MMVITQEAWADALISAWNKHMSLGGALAIAAGIGPDEKITVDKWDAMVDQVSKLRPKLSKFTHLNQKVSVWIASNYTKANACLWAGKQDSAKKWLVSGKDCPAPSTVRKKVLRDIDAEFGKNEKKGSVYVSRRDLNSARTAWNKVK